jgi:predicted amidohydrolase YtcJ
VERRVVYVSDGLLTSRRPRTIDQTINLAGSYVVPPFGDAHAHHFEYPQMVDAINRSYLDAGIFYGFSLNNFVSRKKQVAQHWSRASTVDVAWANAGLTASYGHPVMLFEHLARNSFAWDRRAVWMAGEPMAEGDGYFIIDTTEDLEAKWTEIVSSRPDILKIYLLYSEEYEQRRDDRTEFGSKGLDPRLVKLIVARAHADGLRVAAHVETAADFRTAVSAGVDVIAHLPGYDLPVGMDPERFALSPEDAAAARRRGTAVIPTPLGPRAGDPDASTSRGDRIRQIRHRNVELLVDHGVRLGAGADSFRITSAEHIDALRRTGLFSNLQLLTIWAVDTPQMIFPKRKIGRLEEGYEASLLALSTDPLHDFSAVKSITLRMKQGELLSP